LTKNYNKVTHETIFWKKGHSPIILIFSPTPPGTSSGVKSSASNLFLKVGASECLLVRNKDPCQGAH